MCLCKSPKLSSGVEALGFWPAGADSARCSGQARKVGASTGIRREPLRLTVVIEPKADKKPRRRAKKDVKNASRSLECIENK